MLRHIESGVAGRALGSGYLGWVKDVATRLGIKGVAFTRSDGSIKMLAEGEEESLIEFAKKLKSGTTSVEMQNFYVKWDDAQEELGNFYVLDN